MESDEDEFGEEDESVDIPVGVGQNDNGRPATLAKVKKEVIGKLLWLLWLYGVSTGVGICILFRLLSLWWLP